MPIPIKIKDNTSTIKVKTNSNQDTIHMKNGCGIDSKRLESLIHTETNERIEADENLQQQIDLNKASFIPIYSDHGYIEEQLLNSLKSNKINRISYGSTIYYLSMIIDNIRQYFATNGSKKNEVDVNMDTGEYEVKSTIDAFLQEHINDETVHVTAADREFWNSKVTADAILENPSKQEYKLNLSKD